MVLVPGMGETLRINGRARLTDDARLLAECEVQGRVPAIGLLITVKEAFLHCPKAFVRSGLWDPSKFIDRSSLPTYTAMLADHVVGLTAEESARQGEHHGKARSLLKAKFGFITIVNQVFSKFCRFFSNSN